MVLTVLGLPSMQFLNKVKGIMDKVDAPEINKLLKL